MGKAYKKKNYNTGVQKIYSDTPDYSKVDARKAKTTANNTLVDGTFDSAGQSLMPFNPVAGTSLTVGNKVGQIGQSVIGDNTAGRTFNYGAKGAGAGLAVASSLGPMGMALSPIAIAGGAALGAGYGLITGNTNDAKNKREKRKAERAVTLLNANKKFSENASTDAQSFLAKKGKYKVKPRVIETEGREPIFSPKKKDGTRDLLFYNPSLPNHDQGGIKAMVLPKEKTKYAKGVNKLEGDLISKVIMNRNKDKDFVKRTQATNMFKTFEDFDTKATHKMAYGEDDKGQSYMFPTILNDNNEAIKVPNQYADYISNEGYKKATGMKYKCGTTKMKYGDGSKKLKPPIETTDKRKVQAYNDSLKLYNSYKDLKNNLIKEGYGNYNIPKNNFDRLSEKEVINEANRDKSKDSSFDKYNPFSDKYPEIKAGKEGNLYKTLDFYPGLINEDLGYQYFSDKIKPKSEEFYRKRKYSGDGRLIYNYDNVNPKQPYVLKKEDFKKPLSKLKDFATNVSKDKYLQEINKQKNKPISYQVNDLGEYHFEYKKPVDTRVKTNIEPLTLKQASLNVDSSTPDRILKPVPVNVDKSNRKFAQYPNMKKQLRYKKSASRMVNAKPVDNIVNTFAKGTKALVIPEGSSKYELNQEYDLSLQEIKNLEQQGYKIEY